MKAIDIFYSSVTDCRWFLGNPNINETSGFTWFINSTTLNVHAADWQLSLSESAAEFGNMQGSLPLINSAGERTRATASARPPHRPF